MSLSFLNNEALVKSSRCDIFAIVRVSGGLQFVAARGVGGSRLICWRETLRPTYDGP